MDRAPSPDPDNLRIGAWRLRPDRNEVEKDGRTVRMEPMSMRLLLLLVEKAGRTTNRDEIVDRLWNGRIVSDDAITKQISKLRAYLDDDPRAPRLIETIPKAGVRLIAPVTRETSRQPPSRALRRTLLLAAAITLVAALLLWLRPGEEAMRLSQSPLTTAPGLEYDPAISADGRWLAYAARPADATTAGLYVRTVDEDNARRVTLPGVNARTPAWSAGGRLAFVAERDGRCAIMAGSVLGPFREVSRCVATLGLAWVGEDRLVVSTHPRTGAAFRLVMIDLTSGRTRVLTTPPPGAIGDRLPAMADDSARIFFARSQTVGVEHILELDLASGRIRTVSAESAHVIGLAPGGPNRLLVASNRGTGITGLWRLDTRSVAWRQILPEINGPPSASRDGRSIVIARSQNHLALWRHSLTGDDPSALTVTTRADWAPTLVPDGSLSFLSTRSGAREVWRLATGRAEPERVTRFDGPDIQDPAWSPDAATLAVAVPRANNFDLHFVNVRSGATRPVTTGPADERHPAFSRNGRFLYFARRSGADYDLVGRDIASGRETILLRGGLRALPSDDGQHLYFGRLFVAGLFRLSLADGSVRQITRWPRWSDMRNWTLADGLVWGIARSEDGSAMLMQFDPATGRERQAIEMPPMASASGLAMRPNEAIYTRLVQAESDLSLLRIESDD